MPGSPDRAFSEAPDHPEMTPQTVKQACDLRRYYFTKI
jgi:hypothetical protein